MAVDQERDQASSPTTDTSPKRRRVSPFIFCVSVALALVIGVILGTRAGDFVPSSLYSKRSLNLSSVEQTYTALTQNHDGKLDQQKLIEGASRGLVQAAGDPYTVYFNKQEAKTFSDDLKGTFSGIGAELDQKDNKLIIVSTLPNSPAEKAGLVSNDVIIGINGSDVTGWSIDKAVATIQGKADTTVKLTILRENELKNFSIVRKTINDPSVTSHQKGSIGVITLSRFDNDTAALARKAAAGFMDTHVTGIVLDLRGNGGGYLQAAQDVSSLWLDNGQVVVTERRGSTTTATDRAEGDPILKGIPTVVLVDGGSASASEITAGALQDHHAAKLVGEKTFGKGSVQEVVNLANGAELKVTIAKWYTPAGKNINKQGIQPDITVAVGKNDNSSNDTQLNKALDILK